MRPFVYASGSSAIPPEGSRVRFLAGGTTLVDLMKLGVEVPDFVVDINRIEDPSMGKIEDRGDHLRIGALVTMAEAADHPLLKPYPVVSQSLLLAASQQIRNMASLAGNLLQRTRCPYFRDISYDACNKRNPGSGCSAIHGFNRSHAILGTSAECIATYPGDFAQAMLVLDAEIEVSGRQGRRRLKVEDLHRSSEHPEDETRLTDGELIQAIVIPKRDFRRSLYLKIRDRESYEFALASAAVSLDLDGDIVKEARIALGGVAYRPWRAHKAEETLRGQQLTENSAILASEAAFAEAVPYEHNAFKLPLGKATLVDALMQARQMEI